MTETDPQVLTLVDQIAGKDDLTLIDIADLILADYEGDLDLLAEQSIGGWAYAPVPGPGSDECYASCKKELGWIDDGSVNFDHDWEPGSHDIPTRKIAKMLRNRGIISAEDVAEIVSDVESRAIEYLVKSERRQWIAAYEETKNKADALAMTT